MAIAELFKQYPNRNSELRSVAKTMFEFGKTIAREPSAAHTNGLDEHALRRQNEYVSYARGMVAAIAAKPIPDKPATMPTDMPIDFSDEYITFSEDVNGNRIPLNEATQLLAESWLLTAVELAKSNSASIAGSLVSFDMERATQNIEVIQKLLDEMANRPFLDLPETAAPDSVYGTRSGGTR